MEFQWDDKLVAEFHAKVNGVATFKEDDVQRAMKVMDAFKKAHPFGFKTEDGYCVVDTFHVNDYLFAVDVGTLKVSRVPVMNGEIVGFADVIGKKKFFRYVENMQSYVDLLVSEEVGKLKFDIPKAFKGIIDEEELNKNPHLQFWKKVFDLKECPHQKQKIGFDFDVAQPKNILSFRGGGKVSVYQNGFNYNEWVLGHLKDKHEIFSIQNSLGEILTVGNLTGYGIIERFNILTEGRVFASGKHTKRTKKLVVYCSERNFVWIDPKEVSSIAGKEMPNKEYPEGVLRINFATGYSDSFGNGYGDVLKGKVYQDWCKVFLEAPESKITVVKNSSDNILAVGDMTQFGLIESFSFSENREYIHAYFSPTNVRSDDGRFINIGQVHPVKKEKKYPEGIKRFYGDGSETVDRDFTDKELEYQHWVADNLNQKAKIVCVKNKHGEVLKVGDETNLGCILSFEIRDGIIKMNNEKRFDDLYVIDEVHPLSKGIIIEDGFIVDESEKVWMVVFNNGVPSLGHEVKAVDVNKKYGELHFKEKVNAEKFVDDNKPMFSKKEIEVAIGYSTLPFSKDGMMIKDEFKEKLGLK